MRGVFCVSLLSLLVLASSAKNSVKDRKERAQDLEDGFGVDDQLCEEARDGDAVVEWWEAALSFNSTCSVGASTALELLTSPGSASVDWCERTCFQAAKGLVAASKRIFDLCGGPTAKKRSTFWRSVLVSETTWRQVAASYGAMGKKMSKCAPDDFDEDKRATCETLAASLEEFLSEDATGVHCERIRSNLTSQAQAESFCTANVPGSGAQKSCDKLYRAKLRELKTEGCAAFGVSRRVNRNIAGICDKHKSKFCSPEFKRLFLDPDWDQVVDNVVDQAVDDEVNGTSTIGDDDDVLARACSSDCVRKLAPQYSLWEDSERVDLKLLCSSRNGTGSCYAKYTEAMRLDDPADQAALLCDDDKRCFGRVARNVLAQADVSEELQKQLKAMLKYLCTKKPDGGDGSDDDDGDEFDEDDEATGGQRCLQRVAKAEERLDDTCDSAVAGKSCTAACLESLPSWLRPTDEPSLGGARAPMSACCVNSTLEYRLAVLPSDESAFFVDGWRNLTDTCGLGELPAACPRLGGRKRRKGLKICGVRFDWVGNATGAIQQDILNAFGLTEENLSNLELKRTAACDSNSDSDSEAAQDGGRRRMQDDGGEGVEALFDLQGQDDDDTDHIFDAIDDADMDFSNLGNQLFDDGLITLSETADITAALFDADDADDADVDDGGDELDDISAAIPLAVHIMPAAVAMLFLQAM